MAGPLAMLCSQWKRLPRPTTKYTGETIIVTGSNCGLGLAAVKEFVRLDAAKVIIAVRSLEKGEAAVQEVARATGRPGVAEAWKLDLADYASIQAFARRASQLKRLDVVVENAAVYLFEFGLEAGGDESTMTVNVFGTMLLGMLLLPKLRETAATYNTKTVLTMIGSFLHAWTKFAEQEEPDIFEALRDKDKANMDDRYNVSKLIQLLTFRQLVAEMSQPEKGSVIATVSNPGWVATSISRHTTGLLKIWAKVGGVLIARTPEVGAWTVLHGANGEDGTHGQYLSDCAVAPVSAFVASEKGDEVGKRLWRDLKLKLEKISPGVTAGI